MQLIQGGNIERMLPVLFTIGHFSFYTFGIFVSLAVFFGLFVIWKRGRELHYEEKELFDVIFLTVLAGVIGARLGYVVLHFTDYFASISSVGLVLTRPGWYFPAGLLTVGLAIGQLARNRKWDTYQVMDIMVTGLVLGQAIIALGTFFAGTGYGIPTHSSLGVAFAGVFDKRYPIQLWEAFAFSICFAYLWWVEGVYRTFSWYRKSRSQASTGFIVSMYLIWWGLISLVATLFRSPEFVINNIRLDIVASILSLVVGAHLLFSRSGSGGRNVFENVLEYFGLNIKERAREKRLKAIKEALEK